MKGWYKVKQIIPFKKELLFKTKVSEITSISLEHNLTLKEDDLISGEFSISGDYKMTEGSINREKFTFNLPFDIALDSRYDIDSIVIDIDNFYYEIINNEALKVNIDVYVEGTKVIEEEKEIEEIEEEVIEKTLPKEETNEALLLSKEDIRKSDENYKDLFKEEYTPSVDVSIPTKGILNLENTYKDSTIDKSFSIDKDLIPNMETTETYTTYYVYIVKEEDTIDKIMLKYNVTKEDIEHYNNLDNITPGTKLIIPSINE